MIMENMKEIVVDYDVFNSKQSKTTQYLVYHLINRRTLNRYFGYVMVENVKPVICISRSETEMVQKVLNNGEYLVNEGAVYKSIQKWGYENFDINVVDFFSTEDRAIDKVFGLIERFESNTIYTAYNGKEELNESIMDDTEMIERKLRINQIAEKSCVRQAIREIENKKEVDSIFTIPTKSQKLKNNNNAKTPMVLIDKITGEKICFESKGECMKYLNVTFATFSKFMKGQCKKLNDKWKFKLIKTL